jgi:predicted transcriptional regulator of viral defense system
MRSLRTVRLGELVSPLQLTQRQEFELLNRMSRAGLISRVRPGLYLVPDRLPLGGKWTPGEALALNTLMQDQGARYQICGPNAFNRYGFGDQIPARTYVYNNRLSGERTIGTSTFVFIEVSDKRLGSIEEEKLPDGQTLVYSSRVRTLVDAVYDWSRFNSLPRGYDWIRRELEAKRVTAADMVAVTLRYGDIGTIRRMAALLERLEISKPLLAKLARALPESTSFIPWIPTNPKRGKTIRRWGIVLNESA